MLGIEFQSVQAPGSVAEVANQLLRRTVLAQSTADTALADANRMDEPNGPKTVVLIGCRRTRQAW